MERCPSFFFGDCVVEIGMDVVYVCVCEIHPRGVDQIAVYYCLLIDILHAIEGTHKLTVPLSSPLIIRELLQNIDVIVSP
jgi:hypothetical protein